jgi:hypothetical protein
MYPGRLGRKAPTTAPVGPTLLSVLSSGVLRPSGGGMLAALQPA